jgi:hypothetical protein
MEVGQGPNWGRRAKEKKIDVEHLETYAYYTLFKTKLTTNSIQQSNACINHNMNVYFPLLNKHRAMSGP